MLKVRISRGESAVIKKTQPSLSAAVHQCHYNACMINNQTPANAANPNNSKKRIIHPSLSRHRLAVEAVSHAFDCHIAHTFCYTSPRLGNVTPGYAESLIRHDKTSSVTPIMPDYFDLVIILTLANASAPPSRAVLDRRAAAPPTVHAPAPDRHQRRGTYPG